MGNDIAQEITVSRHETGSADLTVEARDKSGVFLGKATVSFSVTITAEQVRAAKEKAGLPDVTLTADKASPKVGEGVRLTAVAKGGKAPYTYTWQGAVAGQGATVTVVAAKAPQTITVTVNDSAGKSASKSVTITGK